VNLDALLPFVKFTKLVGRNGPAYKMGRRDRVQRLKIMMAVIYLSRAEVGNLRPRSSPPSKIIRPAAPLQIVVL